MNSILLSGNHQTRVSILCRSPSNEWWEMPSLPPATRGNPPTGSIVSAINNEGADSSRTKDIRGSFPVWKSLLCWDSARERRGFFPQRRECHVVYMKAFVSTQVKPKVTRPLLPESLPTGKLSSPIPPVFQRQRHLEDKESWCNLGTSQYCGYESTVFSLLQPLWGNSPNSVPRAHSKAKYLVHKLWNSSDFYLKSRSREFKDYN